MARAKWRYWRESDLYGNSPREKAEGTGNLRNEHNPILTNHAERLHKIDTTVASRVEKTAETTACGVSPDTLSVHFRNPMPRSLDYSRFVGSVASPGKGPARNDIVPRGQCGLELAGKSNPQYLRWGKWHANFLLGSRGDRMHCGWVSRTARVERPGRCQMDQEDVQDVVTTRSTALQGWEDMGGR